MARNKHIRPEHIEAILNVIYTWDEDKLSWDNICDSAKPILGYRPSRAGLSAHHQIQTAYTSRKNNLPQKPVAKTPAPGSIGMASKMLAARDNEIKALNAQIIEYREKFNRWRYNASLLDIKIEKLDQPLPPVKRKE